jgi:branched-chain amino acid transport system permease protein
MTAKSDFDWMSVAKTGLLAGVVVTFLALVGVIEASGGRQVVIGVLSVGQILLVVPFIWAGSRAVRESARGDQQSSADRWTMVAGSVFAGLLTGAVLGLLVFVGGVINLRTVFIKASPALFGMLTLGVGTGPGTLVPPIVGAVLGGLTAGLALLRRRIRTAVSLGLASVPLVAILSSALFAGRGLQPHSAALVFLLVGGVSLMWSANRDKLRSRVESLPPRGQKNLRYGIWVLAGVAVLLLPQLGSYPSQVLNLVGLYVLMGLGLNIVVGFAGLLDLGYVAFFAMGAYTMGVLTSPEIGWLGVQLTFWEALPFAMLVAFLSGIMLGIPVLGMRGDYLAIATLGFGEIIRLVALSDWLKPYIGGSNGITRIPKPILGPVALDNPQTLYYLIIAGCLLVAFVSVRVKDSRLGRAWMAMREDEDVAQAMGINLIHTKLMAFATGATFSGLSGAIFASMLTSIYPHSFHLLVSINVLCLIIVGGMGSIPGVIVGSAALVGLPELLREFAEYRLLFYGAALVIMMLTRPEGLLPEARRRLELHEGDLGAGE